MNASEILDGAADLIERGGWCPQDFGGRCAANAIARVCVHTGVEYEVKSEARAALCSAISKCRGDLLGVIWKWNDTPGRTKAEVIAMLRAVAISERARVEPIVERETA